MTNLQNEGQKLNAAARVLANLNTNDKNQALDLIAKSLLKNIDNILQANKIDVDELSKDETKAKTVDRLLLNKNRIEDIVKSIYTVINLDDPVGVTLSGHTKENGLDIRKITVPLGTIGIIYESRPNVTVDATVLALKSGNAVLLRGSSSAINSNLAIEKAIHEGLSQSKIPIEACILIKDTSRELVMDMLKLDKYLDLIIPRGGAGLISLVTQNATVPTIETGVGNCHLYIDKSADFDMALDILENGKLSRPSVCNALETLVVHQDIADDFLNLVKNRLDKITFKGCDISVKILNCLPATDDDYYNEFLDCTMAVIVVKGFNEAVEHINKYSSHHSEVIITQNYDNSITFQKSIDAACVYVNASSRFTDGGEFGFGCEMGISTQKLHVRGPFALQHLVSTKYLINGNGQIR